MERSQEIKPARRFFEARHKVLGRKVGTRVYAVHQETSSPD